MRGVPEKIPGRGTGRNYWLIMGKTPILTTCLAAIRLGWAGMAFYLYGMALGLRRRNHSFSSRLVSLSELEA